MFLKNIIFLILLLVLYCAKLETTNTNERLPKAKDKQATVLSSQSQSSRRSTAESQRKYLHRVQRFYKYNTTEERKEAVRNGNRKYQKQFTSENIEKAKKELKGEKLQTFLERAENFRQSRRKQSKKARITYKEEVRSNKDVKNPFAHISPEIRALDIQAANAAALSQITTVQGMNEDKTKGIPSNKEMITQSQKKAPRRITDPIKKIQKYKTVEERVQAKRKLERRYQKQFTDEGIEKAKNTLEGDKLEAFLKKAHHYRDVKAQASRKRNEKRRQANSSLKKKEKSQTNRHDPAAILRAANEAAMSQISSTPKFMQKLKQSTDSVTEFEDKH